MNSTGAAVAALAAAGTPIGPYDVLIAGQAKSRGLTLVTNNTSEFHRVVGLRGGGLDGVRVGHKCYNADPGSQRWADAA